MLTDRRRALSCAQFAPIRDSAGIAAIMWVQVAVCLLGWLCSLVLLPDNSSPDAELLLCGRFCACARARPAADSSVAPLRKRGRRSGDVGEVVSNPLALAAVAVVSTPAPSVQAAGAARRERMRAAAAVPAAVT
jgi:hypothetical protein